MNWKDKFPKENIYFETENGILYNGDCLNIMKQFPEESIDLVLTDPPYNIADTFKLTKVKSNIVNTQNAWGNKFKDSWNSLEEYSDWLMNRINIINNINKIHGNLILFLDRKYTGYFIYKIEKHTNYVFRNKIYFEKSNPVPRIRKNNYLSCIEEAIWFTNKTGKYYINFISQKEMHQIFKGNIGHKQTSHPTEKYIYMIHPLIIRHSNINDIVLDPFMGSGTTGLVCEKTNRKWIGIELDKEYCEIAKQRILNEISQTKFNF